eukprot:4226930-Prymnesium_polylepis.2
MCGHSLLRTLSSPRAADMRRGRVACTTRRSRWATVSSSPISSRCGMAPALTVSNANPNPNPNPKARPRKAHSLIEAAAQPEPQSAKDSAKAGERRGQSASDRADGWEDGAWREAVVETAQPGFEARVRTRYVPPCGIGTLFMEQVAHTLIVVLVVPE